MMKHSALAIAFTLAVLLPLCGCAKKTTTSETEKGDTTMNSNTGKSLVVCFSATGNTKGVAQRLAEAIGADFVEIVPEKPYTAADLDWRDKKSRSSVEMADRKSRPAIATAVPNVADYAAVFVGFPIWWYREPSIIDTFIEANAEALAGKTIVPFATSGGSGMGDSSANLQELAPKAKVVEGRRFSTGADAETLKNWAAEFVK
ncbi:MAG: NAD(P)H-dependent oxidoreductase [Victivallales bacterium]|nr:NAD(P)H-dependent oxidoreductase [Victivallales bacterium]